MFDEIPHDAAPIFFMGSPRCSSEHEHDERCSFRIAWSINPHMHPEMPGQNASQAVIQHVELKRTLTAHGARVVELPFIRGAYDSVFVKDSAILVSGRQGQVALLTNPRFAERRLELDQRARDYARAGFEVVPLSRFSVEGGDVVMMPGFARALVGYGPRSEPGCRRELERACGIETVALELRDPFLYHLDTALACLEGGWVLACRAAFSEYAWAELRASVAADRLLEIPYAEARYFACNLVEVGAQVILGCAEQVAPRTYAQLREIGRVPHYVPLDRFQLAGGSAACLVARVHPLAAQGLRATRPTAAIRSTAEYAGVSSSSPKISGSISA